MFQTSSTGVKGNGTIQGESMFSQSSATVMVCQLPIEMMATERSRYCEVLIPFSAHWAPVTRGGFCFGHDG